jgi:hypothetical protein
MTLRWQIEPMPTWPYPETAGRSRSPFSAPWHATIELLTRELDHLHVSGAVAIRVVGSPSDVRRDGMLRATARLAHPGVALSFHTARHGDLTYPCDRFTGGGGEPAWQANVRAVALALEALRKVDRYGVGARGEQYAGWRQIGSGTAEEFTSTQDAVAYLRRLTRDHHADLPELVRAARRDAHPDRRDGDRVLWDRVEAARGRLVADGHLAAS